MEQNYRQLIGQLEAEGVIKTPKVREALEAVDRALFMPPDVASQASEDAPVSIGFGQTISQPRTVAYMLELLQPQEGETVLDVGAGSGWTAALLAHLVGDSGKVYAIERIPQLRHRAEEALAKAGFSDVKLSTGDGATGLQDHGPFDVIHVAAAAKRFPDGLAKQLKPGGRMVVPVGEYVQEMVKAVRAENGEITKTYHGSFSFVPLIEG